MEAELHLLAVQKLCLNVQYGGPVAQANATRLVSLSTCAHDSAHTTRLTMYHASARARQVEIGGAKSIYTFTRCSSYSTCIKIYRDQCHR